MVSYDMLDNNKFKTIVIFDCRGLEPVDFDPRDGWKSQGYKGQLISKGNFSVFNSSKKNPDYPPDICLSHKSQK